MPGLGRIRGGVEGIVLSCLASLSWFRDLIFSLVHDARSRQDARFRIGPLRQQRGPHKIYRRRAGFFKPDVGGTRPYSRVI